MHHFAQWRYRSASKRQPARPDFRTVARLEILEAREMFSAKSLLASSAAATSAPAGAPQATALAVTPSASIQSTWTSQAIAPLTVTQLTGEKPQSKIWEHNAQWFAVMPNSSGTWVWRLEGTGWSPILKLSTDTKALADVKDTGSVTHVLLFHGSSTQLASIEYVGGTYQAWSARPGLASVPLPSNSEIATIDVDSQGRMWVGYDNKSAGTIEVRYSDGAYSNWSAAIPLVYGVNSDDISVLTAMPGGRIGVLWSNQNTKRFGFRTHLDGDNPGNWSANEVPASASALKVGAGMADDHLNVAVASDGTLYAAVKTSYDTSGYAKIALLVRHPNGTWDPLYTVSTSGTRGIVLLNEQQHRLIVAYTSSESGGNILYRETSTDSISFGPTGVLIGGTLNNVTSTKQNFTDDLVVMAGTGSKAQAVYLHGPASPAAATNQAPTVSAGPDLNVATGATVSLAGSASDDGLPQPAALTMTWSVVSGPGAVSFANNNLASTSATFSAAGNYVLRLTAFDGALSASDDVNVTVASSTPPPPPPPPPPPSPTSPVVGYWQFNEGAGTLANDSSIAQNQGTLLGGAKFATGHAGSGLSLTGASQRTVVADAASLDITQSVTIGAWIAPQTVDTQYLVKKAHNQSVDGYELSLSATGKVFVRFNQASSGDTFRVDSTSSYPTNGTTWMHVVATYDGATIRLYINGQLQASKAATFTIKANNLGLGIGAEDSGYRPLRGKMDDVLVANRAFTTAEVVALYQGTFSIGPTATSFAMASPSAVPAASPMASPADAAMVDNSAEDNPPAQQPPAPKLLMAGGSSRSSTSSISLRSGLLSSSSKPT
jgi:hypothetical protein